jgi:putative ABC transport system substrate-binding protein
MQLRAFRQGLRELGYVEGKNVIIETRFAEGRNERLPELVAELLRLKIDVLLAGSTPGALAAKKTTPTVPIVFAGVLDPVGSGIVSSLARPGGNITGVSVGVGGEGFTAKCLQLLREAAPGLSHLAVLVNPSHPLSMQFRREVQAFAKNVNMKFDVREVANANGLERALAAIGASEAQGIFVAPDPFLTASGARIARLAVDSRLPALHFSKSFAEAGGLMAYGPTLDESYRRAAAHVDKILKGTKPAALPVEQPTKFELVINLKAAKALGLTIPPSLLLRADHVIE